MSRRIKTSILRSNNLGMLGSHSRATYNCPDEASTYSNQSSRYTLKSLSQQRNIVKILRKMDSPGALQMSGDSLKSEVYETLFTIQEQVHALGQNRNNRNNRQDRRESIERVLRKGVPRSKISLTDKENISCNTPAETNRSKQLNISKSILEKLKVIPLRNTNQTTTTATFTTIGSKQSLNSSSCKRRGIYLYQRLK